MIKKIFYFIFIFALFFVNFFVSAKEDENCVQLNTNIPFIGNEICMWEKSSQNWDKTTVTADDAFPVLVGWLMKILIAIIIAVGLLMIIWGGILISSSWADQSLYGKWKDMIMKVIIWIALLGLSWLILHMINPNFFKL